AGSRKVSVRADVLRAPKTGHVYWLILKIDQVSGTHPEFYPRRMLPLEPDGISFPMTIPDDADITRPRTGSVVQVPEATSDRYATGRPDPRDGDADFLLSAPCCAVTGEIDLPFRE
ncbi:hypothetical protein AB0M20_32960, partial [Actinoplanes sp. NPDC051633]|uniref:hypothetical protein n=1 Tax=Actinoplanes sp. NPDC051633 TaxID=3155670 RepID=UPI003439C383